MVNDGQWHHFVLVRAGKRSRSIGDGALQGTSTKDGAGGPITTNLRAFGPDRVWLKENSGQPQQRLSLDDLRIYLRALRAAEIAAFAKP
jgi:Concanavalin A-like lectin/glucanases superfamily